MTLRPGPVVLLGSGETSPNVRKVYDQLFRRLEVPVRAAILETPAGFEPNSAFVAGQIGDFLVQRLQNYRPRVSILPARKKGTDFSPDDPAIAAPLFDADVIMLGPGSPTYAARQLCDSYAWHALQACHRLGATVVFASAATLAASTQTLPVYEIYKVGEELHWKTGLDFFGAYGLQLVFVPHWNNNDGGRDLDTSRCYIGQERFGRLAVALPARIDREFTVVGIEEQTALVIEPAEARCWVQGPGGVVLVRDGVERRFESGANFPTAELGPFHLPRGDQGVPAQIWADAQAAVATARDARGQVAGPPADVQALVTQREMARQARDWAVADRLREAISAAGWQVQDTPDGPTVVANDG